MKLLQSLCYFLAAIAFAAGMTAMPLSAATVDWLTTPATQDFGTAANWTPNAVFDGSDDFLVNVSAASDSPVISVLDPALTGATLRVGNGGAGLLTMTGGSLSLSGLLAVGAAGSSTGDLEVTGGTLHFGGDFVTGEGGGAGVTNISNATFGGTGGQLRAGCYGGNGTIAFNNTTIASNFGEIWLGHAANGYGKLSLSGTTLTGAGVFLGSHDATAQGILELTDSTITANGQFMVGNAGGAGGTGSVTLNGASVANVTGEIVIGCDGASGTMQLNGSSVVNELTGNWTHVGHDTGGTALLELNGSSTFNNLITKIWTGGTVTLNGSSTLNSPSSVILGGTLNLNASSTVILPCFNAHGMTGTLNIDGGTIKPSGTLNATATWGSFLDPNDPYPFFTETQIPTVNVLSGGAKFDTAGFNMKVNAPLLAGIGSTGGLTKTGAGTLLLDTSAGTTLICTYTGLTDIQQGTLKLNDVSLPAGNSVIVRAGATLGGRTALGTTPSIPAVTVESNATVAPGTPGQTFYISSLNLSGGSNLNFTFTASGDVVDSITADAISPAGSDPVIVNINYAGGIPSNTRSTLLLYGTLDSNVQFNLFGGVPVLDSPDGINAPAAIDTSIYGQVDLIKGGILADTVPAWNNGAGGNWSDNAKWGNDPPPPAQLHPDGGADRGLFVKALGAGVIPVKLNISPRLSSMIFASPTAGGESYDITPLTGTETITLDSGIAQNWHVTVLSGKHAVAANMLLGAGTGPFAGQSAIRLANDSHLILSGVLSDETKKAGVNFNGNFVTGGVNLGVLTLSGLNTYSGPTTITTGTLEATSIANHDVANSLGKVADASPANLVLQSGTLHYTGVVPASTDRGFTVLPGISYIKVDSDLEFGGQIAGDGGILVPQGPGKLITSHAGASTLANLDVGYAVPGNFEQTAGTLTITGHFGVGGQTTAGASFCYMTGGTLDITGTSGNTAYVGGANDLGVDIGEGHLIMSGNATVNLAAGSYMVVGDNKQPFSGGAPSVGTIELSGNAQLNACQLYTGVRGGVASITVGGSAVLTTIPAFDTITLGYPGPGGGLGVLNVAGGTVHVKNYARYNTSLVVGDASTGVLNAGSGLLNGDDGVIEIRGLGIANIGTAGGTGQVTVQIGGFAPYIFDHANRGIINFHGGIIMPTVSSGTFLQELAAATVYSEGAVFDTDGHDITVAQNLVKPDGKGVVTLDIPLANRGQGYKVAPVVALTTASGDTGSGATAVAEMESDGAGGLRVAKIVITNPGTNYLAAPTVTLYGGGAAATADLSALSLSLADNVSGGLTKNGLGSLTLTGALTYAGDTTVNVGTLNATTGIDTPNAAVYVATGATLNASSIVADTLTIGGAPHVAASAVPEPGTLVLLVLFGMGALLAWRRKRNVM